MLFAFGALLSLNLWAATPAPEVKLLFSTLEDTTNVWGKLHFGATPLEKIRSCENPGFSIAYCKPGKDGSWEIYGQIFSGDAGAIEPQSNKVWRLIRATTRDGVIFENVRTVYESEPGNWTDHIGLAYNPIAKEYFALKLKIDDNGFAYKAYFSPDGETWRENSGNPLFYDCDSMGLFWSDAIKGFICTAKTLQPYPKHIRDHGGIHPQNNDNNLRDRRVISIRSSVDGRQWTPSDSMMDVWNRLGTYKAMPPESMRTPDADDPPDMEFYRGIGFWYHDRSYLMALNYAASALPSYRSKHGPQLDTEWWTSRDGLKWNRPYRGINALGDVFPGKFCITHNPMVIDGILLFHFGNQLLGMKEDRISFVGARANAEFDTRRFMMPAGDLCLNASVPSTDRSFATKQAYVMAAVLDEKGNVVPGYEAEKCIIENADKTDLPLRWGDKSARELAGRSIGLRFYLRSANIYAVTSRQ